MMEEGEEKSDGEEEVGEERESTLFRAKRRKPAPNAAAGRGAPARAELAALALSLGARVIRQDKHSLNLITNNASHQGVVLECGPLEWERTSSLLEAEEERKEREREEEGAREEERGGEATATTTLLSSFASSSSSAASSSPSSSSSAPRRIPVWLVLDQVADPQNLGAILRSALFLGASGVLLSPKNCAPPNSAAASKASAGALEWLRVRAAAGPLPALLREARGVGNWAVLGADAGREGARGARRTARELLRLGGGGGGGGASSSSSSSFDAAAPAVEEESGGAAVPRPRPPAGIALVLGSEGAGLRPMVAAECTGFVKVSGRGRKKERNTGGGGGGNSSSSIGGSGSGSASEKAALLSSSSAAAVGSGEGAVDSLNVSVAAALLLHDLLDVFGGEEEDDDEEE